MLGGSPSLKIHLSSASHLEKGDLSIILALKVLMLTTMHAGSVAEEDFGHFFLLASPFPSLSHSSFTATLASAKPVIQNIELSNLTK